MPEPNITGDEAAHLRRALVRFLVEASWEETPQAKVAGELLEAVRAVPAQSADQVAGLERRIDQLAAQLDQLAGAVKAAGAGASQAAPHARGLVSGIAAGVITGIASALLTATLLAGSLPGLSHKAPAPTPAALVVSAAAPAAPVSPLAPAANTGSVARLGAVVADPAGAPAAGAWEELWGRILAAPVSSCAAGGGVALRRCVCPAPTDEDCTLAQAQSVPGGPVMVAQALIKVRLPALQNREEIDGRLGPATARALVKLTRGCGHVGKLAQELAQQSKGRSGFDADRALEPILTGLAQEAQCVEEPPP